MFINKNVVELHKIIITPKSPILSDIAILILDYYLALRYRKIRHICVLLKQINIKENLV